MPKHSSRSDIDSSVVDVAKATNPLFKDLVLVGRGSITNSKWGSFRGFYGCIREHEGGVVFAYGYCCS